MRAAIILRRAQEGTVWIIDKPRNACATPLVRVNPSGAELALCTIVRIETETSTRSGPISRHIHGVVATVRLVATNARAVWVVASVNVCRVASSAVLRRVVRDWAQLALRPSPLVTASAAAGPVRQLYDRRRV